MLKNHLEPTKSTKEKIVNPRDALIKQLGFRGLEVLTNAESQFPNETKMIIDKLYELIKTGEITEILDGGKLLGIVSFNWIKHKDGYKN